MHNEITTDRALAAAGVIPRIVGAALNMALSHGGRRRLGKLLALVTLACLPAAASVLAEEIGDTAAHPNRGSETLAGQHKLEPGDRLSFRIVEDQVDPKEPAEPKSLTVADSGDLEVPYIGRVPVLGKTCKQAAQEIKAELEKKYYYHATVVMAVDVNAKSAGKCYVAGQVRLTGPVDLPSDETLTVSKAVLRAGGFTEYADEHHVKLIRRIEASAQRSKTTIVDLNKVIEEGKTDKDMVLEPGDIIFVPNRLFTF